MTIHAARSILVVDDDEDIRASLGEILAEEGATVTLAASAEEALRLLGDVRPDLVVCDVRMPGLGGLELLRVVRERAQGVDVVLMTAYDDMPTIVEAMRHGAADFLTKPLDLRDLRVLLARVFADREMRRPRRREQAGESTSDAGAHDVPRDRLDAVAVRGAEHLVGRDPHMRRIYKLVGQVAAHRTNVLVRGESGTGKELIARAVHRHSPDAAQPFVAVNCTAVPSALLESELFGHLRGSFTGAVADRRGRFALAGRGTIFLDEIGDTTPEFQAKLLRVLEDREYFPVGAERPERTEARVIAATHRNLEELIEERLFRADLYYRLRVVEITIPPLRERPGDIPLLAEHLVRRAAQRLGLPAPPLIAPDAMAELVRWRWPGNVRELDNCLTRAVLLASGGVIRADLLEMLPERRREARAPVTLAEAERDHIVRVLTSTGGNKARAARLLGIPRPRLDRLLTKHGIMPS